MDKKNIIGIVLIAVIMIAWMVYQTTHQEVSKPNEQPQDTTAVTNEQNPDNQAKANENIQPIADSTANLDTTIRNKAIKDKFGELFYKYAQGTEQLITINTDNYQAVFSNKGGSIVRWRLKHYNKWDGVNVQFINYKEYEFYLNFTSIEAKRIDGRDLYFDVEGLNGANNITLTGEETKELVFKIDMGNGKELAKKITFYGDKYHIEQDISLSNLENHIKSGYALTWGHNLNYQEKSSIEESNSSLAIISMNGSIKELDITDYELESESFTGIIDYTAIKTKYFTTAIIPQPWQKFDSRAILSGKAKDVPNQGKVEDYQMSLNVPYKGGSQTNSFKVFIGPLEYKLVASYGLEATVDLGWRFLIRPIAEWLMLPLFQAVHRFVPNYGIAIIVFSILMKILLTPLSLKQLRNASYMKLLTPEITKVREKYAEDKQKQQMETMALYTQYGINPASGCLPLLIQMPILFALWRTLNAFIELRQQPFVWWITDLSSPDVLVNWGFSVLGMTQISGLALLMAITLFVQQKMTITDPNQKAMIYMMPVMFLFMFSNLPSGLNLYYFIFNLLSIGQQVYMNNFSSKKVTLEDLKRNPKKKEGFLAKQMRLAQEMQKTTGRSMPPAMQKYIDAKQAKDKNQQTNRNKNNKKNKR